MIGEAKEAVPWLKVEKGKSFESQLDIRIYLNGN